LKFETSVKFVISASQMETSWVDVGEFVSSWEVTNVHGGPQYCWYRRVCSISLL